MKRLREIEARTALLQKAQSLIESAEPVPDDEARMLRVRRALDRPRTGAVRKLPALAVAALIALFGATAFAAVRIYVAIEQPAAKPAAESAERARGARARKPAQPAQEAAAQPADALGASADQLAAAASDGLAPALRGGAMSAGDSELVHRALKALRRDRDPARAASLLAQHRAQSPNSPLAEEVLSLQIEAALALREPAARTLAREYVARYPAGRYLAVARRALAGAAP